MTITAPAVSKTFRPDEILQHLPQLHARLNLMFPAIGVQLRSHVCQQRVCVCVCWNDCVALDVQPPGSKLGLAWCCDGRGEAALWTCTFNLGDLLICHIVRADEPQHSCMRLQVIGQRRPVCGSLVALLSPPSGNTMSIIPATLHQFSQNAHDYARFSCQRIKVRPFQRI